jgi:hypothetical protein
VGKKRRLRSDPWGISRADLVSSLGRIRGSILARFQRDAQGGAIALDKEEEENEEERHSVLISDMGNYTDILHNKVVLRDPLADDEEAARPINFGSPFRKQMVVEAVDEAEGVPADRKRPVEGTKGKGPPRSKRKTAERPSFGAFVQNHKERQRRPNLPQGEPRPALPSAPPPPPEVLASPGMRRALFWRANDLLAFRRFFTVHVLRARTPDLVEFR